MTSTALVLGGSAGVGRATVESLVAAGYKVGVVARGQDRLASLKNELGARVEVESGDVSDAAGLATAVDALIGRLGAAPEVWVNCAMLTSFSPFSEIGPEEFDEIVQTTFLGQVNGTRLALARMHRGQIVHVGSGLAYRSVPLQTAYCASKAAIRAFVSSLNSELIHSGSPISLSHVLLPAVNTPQFDWARNRLEDKPQPAPPIYDPSVAARGIMYAIRNRAREVIVGQSVYQIVMGEAVAPGLMDRIMASAGTKAQKSGTPDPGGRPDNLGQPVAWDVAARGRFVDRSRDSGLVLDADLARIATFGGGALVALGIGALLGRLTR